MTLNSFLPERRSKKKKKREKDEKDAFPTGLYQQKTHLPLYSTKKYRKVTGILLKIGVHNEGEEKKNNNPIQDNEDLNSDPEKKRKKKKKRNPPLTHRSGATWSLSVAALLCLLVSPHTHTHCRLCKEIGARRSQY